MMPICFCPEDLPLEKALCMSPSLCASALGIVWITLVSSVVQDEAAYSYMNETLAVMVRYDLTVTVKRNSERNSKCQNVHVVMHGFSLFAFRERERKRESCLHHYLFSVCLKVKCSTVIGIKYYSLFCVFESLNSLHLFPCFTLSCYALISYIKV